jgi:hypothetical protein
MFAVDDFANELTAGHCAAVAALVIALDEFGILSKSHYSNILESLWEEMPDEVAVGEAGVVIERVLEHLRGGDGEAETTDTSAPVHDLRAGPGGAANDGTILAFART